MAIIGANTVHIPPYLVIITKINTFSILRVLKLTNVSSESRSSACLRTAGSKDKAKNKRRKYADKGKEQPVTVQ